MTMLLTPELLDRVHLVNPLPTAAPPSARMSDEEVERLCEELVGRRPSNDRLHVFAYGSLLWNPAFTPDREEPATALGWHRAFRMRQMSWRGTPENPGLMMVLDRGGSCRGIAMSVVAENGRSAVKALIRREMSTRSTANQPRWISIDIQGRREAALAFCIDRMSAVYSGRQSDDVVADILARASGPAGSCAEYLMKTTQALKHRRIEDRHLAKLEGLVARRLQDTPPQ
jgi:cation transport protein ChaC